MFKFSLLESVKDLTQRRIKSGTRNKFQKWAFDTFGVRKDYKNQMCEDLGISLPVLNSWLKGEMIKKTEDLIKLKEITRLSYEDLIES